MNKEDFLEKIADILQTDNQISYDTILEDLEEWDSLSKIATIAFMSQNFNVTLTFSDFNQIKQIKDLATKAGL